MQRVSQRNALQESRHFVTVMTIVDEVKEKDAPRGRNRNVIPRVMKPVPIRFRHFDMLEAVWNWREVRRHAKVDKKVMHPSV